MSLRSNEFLKGLNNSGTKNLSVKLATVTGSAAAGVYVKFFGDESTSSKSYKRVASYEPAAGDTVALININDSYLIIGKVV